MFHNLKKKLKLNQQVKVQGEFLLWRSGLRTQGGRTCGIGPSCSLDSVPGLGTSICHYCSQREKKKKKKKRYGVVCREGGGTQMAAGGLQRRDKLCSHFCDQKSQEVLGFWASFLRSQLSVLAVASLLSFHSSLGLPRILFSFTGSQAIFITLFSSLHQAGQPCHRKKLLLAVHLTFFPQHPTGPLVLEFFSPPLPCSINI